MCTGGRMQLRSVVETPHTMHDVRMTTAHATKVAARPSSHTSFSFLECRGFQSKCRPYHKLRPSSSWYIWYDQDRCSPFPTPNMYSARFLPCRPFTRSGKRAHRLHAARCRHIKLHNLVPPRLTRLEHELGHSPRLRCCTCWPSHHLAGLPRDRHAIHHRYCTVPSRLRLGHRLVPLYQLRPDIHMSLKRGCR